MEKRKRTSNANDSLKAMASRFTVNVGGEDYPCYFTMGAAIAFKDITGRDTTEMDNGLADLAVYLYACCKSACRREKKDFPFDDVQAFADNIDMEELARVSEELLGGGDGEKKT